MNSTGRPKKPLKRKKVTVRLRPQFASFLQTKARTERVSQALIIETLITKDGKNVVFPIKRVTGA
jgi:hypothetical protein